jgi:hypothetical protein
VGGNGVSPPTQERIKRVQLRSNDGANLCFFRIILVVVLVLVIGLSARVFDYDYDDEDDDDSRTAPSTRPGTLVALAKSSLMQPCSPLSFLARQGGVLPPHSAPLCVGHRH